MATSCDVTFRVGQKGKKLHSNRSLLMNKSQVFRAMLCGPLAEEGQIKIPDVDSDAFQEFLTFLGTSSCVINHDNVTSLLYLAQKYYVERLECSCLNFMHNVLAPENACAILEHAHIFDQKHLYEKALNVIKNNSEAINNDVNNLCEDCFNRIIGMKESTLKPHTLFRAAMFWADAQCRRQGREITLSNITSCIKDCFKVIPLLHLNSANTSSLLWEDDMNTIMNFYQHVEGHRLLFQHRVSSDCEGMVPSCLPTIDIFFYEDRSPSSAPTLGTAEDGIDFTFNTNVMLYGVYLIKPEGNTAHVHLTIQKFPLPFCLEDSDYDISIHESTKEPYMEVVLKRPFPLQKNVRYCMYASMRKGAQLLCVGKDPRKTVVLGDCTFTRNHQEYVNTVNMIHGFRVGYEIGHSLPTELQKSGDN